MTQSGTTKWVRLGDYIEQCDERAGDNYTLDDVVGISTDKKLIATKANMDGVSLNSYKVVKPFEFAYVADTSRRGDKIALALNTTAKPVLISSIYTSFRCKDKEELMPEYLFMLLNRTEFDRYARFNSWGSARETFDWSELCRVQIPLPSPEVQQELVDTYNGIKAIAEQNEALYQRLSAACHAYIVDCRAKYEPVPLGEYIEVDDTKNVGGHPYPFYGVNKDVGFIPTVADTNKLDNSKYKIVKKGIFVFNGMHVGRDIAIPLSMYDGDNPIIVSPAYTTFKVTDETLLLPEFLSIQFNRSETGRYGWFLCDNSVRGGLEWKRFCDFPISIPPMQIQRAIVDVFNCAQRAKKIATEARERLKTLCPALVQRAANS